MLNLAGKTIALVGGAGFIGHNLALSLKEKGADVHVFDSFQVNNLINFIAAGMEVSNRDLYLDILLERVNLLRQAGIPIHILDARDYHLTTQAFNRIKPQIVVHLAAVAHANVANKDPYSTFDHSLRTLENSLDSLRSPKWDFERLIFMSSSMVYGDFDGGTVTEDSICNPLGVYGALKFAGEKMVIAYNQVFGLPYTIVRPSALYGERCVSRRVGQVFIENAINGHEITIAGDGNEYLDFTYIQDLIQGLTLAMVEPKSLNQIFNLTYGNARTIGEMASILLKHFPDATLRHIPRDRLMPKRGTLSVEKAHDLLGFKPTFPLETGFPQYIRWYDSLIKDKGAVPVFIE
ncbi:NAD(P)-dependent oxidoreductase [Azospirillum cavernae]|uniref:NAD(P)-dependent oxidoreductase n=1 Tax=Azospirillum cavernae TaxID=2320860 RepID=A0A418VKY2_9PROT|nr:NAD(P)-dependent oxidoreductase [Azospirillum cavernae]RJF76807.1 NAD(P)-dependent oxidoreductase [Azospirillum cavernae]